MIKNSEIGRNLVKFRPDLIKSERAMGYLTGSLGNSTARFGGLFSWHFFVELAQENAFETTKKRKTKP